MRRSLASLLVAGLAATACSGTESSDSTTTDAAPVPTETSAAPATTSATTAPTTTSATTTSPTSSTIASTTTSTTPTTTPTTTSSTTTPPSFLVDPEISRLVSTVVGPAGLACVEDTIDGADFNATSRAVAACATPDELREIIRLTFEAELTNPGSLAEDIADLPDEADGEAFFACFLDSIDSIGDDAITDAFITADSARGLGQNIGRELAVLCLSEAFDDLGVDAVTAVDRLIAAMTEVDAVERVPEVAPLDGVDLHVVGPSSNPEFVAVELVGSGALLSLELLLSVPPTDVQAAALDEVGRLFAIETSDIDAALDESNLDGIDLENVRLCVRENGTLFRIAPLSFACE